MKYLEGIECSVKSWGFILVWVIWRECGFVFDVVVVGECVDVGCINSYSNFVGWMEGIIKCGMGGIVCSSGRIL